MKKPTKKEDKKPAKAASRKKEDKKPTAKKAAPRRSGY